MNFESVIKTIDKLLTEKQPQTFNRSWVRVNAPCAYRFIQKKVRIENGGIDWDRITCELNPKFQKQGIGSVRKKAKSYRNKTEVAVVLNKYRHKLYTFLAPADKNDEYIRDIISIALVRIAQKGNISAREEIIKWLSYTINDWIERCPTLSCWKGHEQLIQTRLNCCIRCYRYSGSCVRYVFKTLEFWSERSKRIRYCLDLKNRSGCSLPLELQYAARGLRPLIAYSLDDSLHCGKRKRIDSIG